MGPALGVGYIELTNQPAPTDCITIGLGFQLGGGSKKQQGGELRAFAGSIGFKFVRRNGNEGSQLRGKIDGYKIRVRTAHHGRCEIEVRYESGLQSFSIYDRAEDVRTNRVEIATEDSAFDTRFRTLTGTETGSAVLLNYLTPQRRQVITALGEAFTMHKIEDDEFEVHLPKDPEVAAIREAIDFCLKAAKVLDETPQDAVWPAA